LSPIRDLEETIIPPLSAPDDPFQCLESPAELVQSLPFSLIVFVGDDLLLPKSYEDHISKTPLIFSFALSIWVTK
jgi:hypothetical protein